MHEFDLKQKIVNSSCIFEESGGLQSFSESRVISLGFKRGNYSPDMGGFEDPVIEASLEFSHEDPPYVLDMVFFECSSIDMSYFNHDNVIEALSFDVEARGFYADGTTPLPPFICVEIGTRGQTVHASFKCFTIEVLGKREILKPPEIAPA
ncbi:hypothetical protein PMI14_02083 [Acidovorax sp. CF316]|uniref:hypothetical protein n=1 Tax=Acidovorax sp. CF316 TaxID=1144317 RepID=UPI00026BDE90|nr:hypothetical protein [Acidovorax sp. CF316]EJE53184.1 hypothetical protein PMI14_02083 [Acidovorax sp. CF316]